VFRVAGIKEFGGPVAILELDGPRTPCEREVLIEVKATGVGNWDEFVRAGRWDVGRKPPLALGVEAAGVITAAGSGVEQWAVGDEVLTHPLPLADQGTWASRLIARADALARKPAGVSWAHAGALPVPALTAVQVLDEALGVRRGETLLVNGAGSVTGGLIVSLAALRRAHVFATAGPSSRERVTRAGATMIVDYHDADWPRQILDASGGHGVDAAANAAPGGSTSALRAVRDGGRLATITSDPPRPERGIAIASVYVHSDARQLEQAAQALAAGQLELTIGACFELPRAAAALARATAGSGGAVVLQP
jgi:NADPH:quinone reductase-like Zn-dependent oxidoreductase